MMYQRTFDTAKAVKATKVAEFVVNYNRAFIQLNETPVAHLSIQEIELLMATTICPLYIAKHALECMHDDTYLGVRGLSSLDDDEDVEEIQVFEEVELRRLLLEDAEEYQCFLSEIMSIVVRNYDLKHHISDALDMVRDMVNQYIGCEAFPNSTFLWNDEGYPEEHHVVMDGRSLWE